MPSCRFRTSQGQPAPKHFSFPYPKASVSPISLRARTTYYTVAYGIKPSTPYPLLKQPKLHPPKKALIASPCWARRMFLTMAESSVCRALCDSWGCFNGFRVPRPSRVSRVSRVWGLGFQGLQGLSLGFRVSRASWVEYRASRVWGASLFH